MSNLKRVFVACLFLITIAFFTADPMHAQVDTGSVTGTILDPGGNAIVGAAVTLSSTSGGSTFTQQTNSEGLFTFPIVRIGAYTLTAEASGFGKVTQNNLNVSIQQTVSVNLTLQPGSVTSIVEVTTEPAQLQTEDASVGNVVGERQIQNLPLNGRNFTFLAQLSAGVTVSQQDTRGLAQNGGFAANGTPPNQNNYLLDGVDNNSNLNDYLNGAYYVYLPSVDALQEFKVQTSNFSAEFGRAAGAVMNATTKSGTDRIHGSLYEFIRNDALNARNYFETTKGKFRLNQFGATLGGPVVIPHLFNGVKHRMYFFGDYQGGRIVQATPFTSSVPTALERSSGFTNLSELISGQGNTSWAPDALGRTYNVGQVFDPATTRYVAPGSVDPVTGRVADARGGYVRDPFAGNIIPLNRINPNAAKLLAVYPAPNLGAPGAIANNYVSNPSLTDDVNQGDARLDKIFGDKGSIFIRGSINRQHTFVPPPFASIANGGAFASGQQTNDEKDHVLGWTYIINQSMVNEARVGYSRIGTSRYQTFSSDLTIPSQFGIQGIPQFANNGGLPTYNIAGLSQLGASPWLPTSETGTVFQVNENLSKISGKHSLKGGFAYQRIGISFFQPPYGRGNFTFNGVYTDPAALVASGAGTNSTLTSGGGSTGLAQLLITPIHGAYASGASPSQCASTPNCVGDYIGGADKVQASNAANTAIKRNYYALYIQDDWKLTQKLTVNLGLRWEYVGHGVSEGGRQANFVPAQDGHGPQFLMKTETCNKNLSTSFTTLMAAANIPIVCTNLGPLVTTQKTLFAPRLGFAYQIRSNLVLRGAYGMFYGAATNGDNLGTARNYPFSFNFVYNYPNNANPILYPDGSGATLERGLASVNLTPQNVNAQGLSLGGTQFHLQVPYFQTQNLAIEYQFTRAMTFTIGYVGNAGHHIVGGPPQNQVSTLAPPTTNPQTLIPYPSFARGFGYYATQANSHYNSLQTSLSGRWSNGSSFLANYTYSQCMTDARDGLNNNIGAYRANGVPGFGIKGDYGRCDYNVRNMIHGSGTYALPFGRGQRFGGGVNGWVDQMIGHWTANTIITLQGGQPFTVPCTITTAAGLGCYANVDKTKDLYGEHSVNHWVNADAFYNPAPVTADPATKTFAALGGRGSQADGPGFHRMDLSLLKAFPIHEDVRAEFRTELFNVTNTPQFGIPGFSGPGVVAAAGSLNFVTKTNFGKITATRDGAYDQREFQFAVKLYW